MICHISSGVTYDAFASLSFAALFMAAVSHHQRLIPLKKESAQMILLQSVIAFFSCLHGFFL